MAMQFIDINGVKVRVAETNSQLATGLIRYPVRVFRDSWRGTDRVLRYQGRCAAGCGRATWAFDDGENDPRGFLGDRAAYDLAEEVTEAVIDMRGEAYRPWIVPTVACALCSNEQDSYLAAVQSGILRSIRKAERNGAKAQVTA
jgi:hypothetical protein